MKPYQKDNIPRAKELRKNMTPGEKKLWYQVLNQSKMMNYRFLRQRAIDNHIADFFCKELKLLIEVDGTHHDLQQKEDEQRDTRLKILGYETFRVSHYMVMTDIENVVRAIEAKVLEREEALGIKHSDSPL